MGRLSNHQKDVTVSGMEMLIRVDLHYWDSKSDKVYILQVEKHLTSGTYSVHCYYGRNGQSNLNKMSYGTYPHNGYQDAKKKLRQIQHNKENKGYKFIHEEEVTSMGTMVSSPTQTNLVSTPKTKATLEMVNEHGRGILQTMKRNTAWVNMNVTDQADFLKRIKSDDVVMFNLPTMRMYYAFLEHDVWLLYDAGDVSQRPDPEYFKDPLPGFNPKIGTSLDGLGWFGILDNNNEFIILDIISAPGVDKVHYKPWTVRRQMMNIAYEQLYPGLDPYAPTAKMKFADYVHSGKDAAFNFGSGIFAAFNVKQRFNSKFYVCTK